MTQYDGCVTSYRVAHKFIPSETLENNVTDLDTLKELMPNNPNLKQWSYETTTNNSYDFKFDTVDPIQKAARVHCNDQIQYLMPQWEKYWSNFSKPTRTPQTEYNNTFMQPKLMSNIQQISITCAQPKQLDVHREIPQMSVPIISEKGVVRKKDPYVSTQKLSYIKINPITDKQINSKQSKQTKIMPDYESFYNEPISNRRNTIRILPDTLKHVPHNGLRTEMSDSYRIPINTLSQNESTVEMPISISKITTLTQILSVPGMYTTEYSKISAHKNMELRIDLND